MRWRSVQLGGSAELVHEGQSSRRFSVPSELAVPWDDLLCAVFPEALETVKAIGDKLGFGSEEYDSFVWCGKSFERRANGDVVMHMRAYRENLSYVDVSRERAHDPTCPLVSSECKVLVATCSGLWHNCVLT